MIVNSKKGSGSISTALKVVISVVIGGLILLGVISIIDNIVGPKVINTFNSQQDFSDVTSEDEVILGDINGDGNITLEDLNDLKEYMENPDSNIAPLMAVADINKDGVLNAEDIDALRGILASNNVSYQRGDINKDGELNSSDVVYLERYLANWDGYSISDSDKNLADMNSDGTINDADLQILKGLV